MTQETVRYPTSDEVDFVIVGSGAAGGVLAKELSTNGFSVVVLEQGPYLRPFQFRHDEAESYFGDGLIGRLSDHPHSWRASADQEAQPAFFAPSVFYAKAVGGSSLHFAANYWRFRPVDFRERSLLGEISGTSLADWPITYDELEPYYAKVDWEIGVSGEPGTCGPAEVAPLSDAPHADQIVRSAPPRRGRARGIHVSARAPRDSLTAPQRSRAVRSLRSLLGPAV